MLCGFSHLNLLFFHFPSLFFRSPLLPNFVFFVIFVVKIPDPGFARPLQGGVPRTTLEVLWLERRGD